MTNGLGKRHVVCYICINIGFLDLNLIGDPLSNK